MDLLAKVSEFLAYLGTDGVKSGRADDRDVFWKLGLVNMQTLSTRKMHGLYFRFFLR